MAKLSARGCTVLARVEMETEIAEGRTCRFYRVLRSDGRILGRSRWVGADAHGDGWVVLPSRILGTLPPEVVRAWVNAKVASGWVRS